MKALLAEQGEELQALRNAKGQGVSAALGGVSVLASRAGLGKFLGGKPDEHGR